MKAVVDVAALASYTAATNAVSRATASRIIEDVFDYIRDAVGRGEIVHIKGFGKFSTRTLPARTGINPKTKEPIAIAASTLVKFKPMSALRSEVKNQ